jgi:hypothetical protein
LFNTDGTYCTEVIATARGEGWVILLLVAFSKLPDRTSNRWMIGASDLQAHLIGNTTTKYLPFYGSKISSLYFNCISSARPYAIKWMDRFQKQGLGSGSYITISSLYFSDISLARPYAVKWIDRFRQHGLGVGWVANSNVCCTCPHHDKLSLLQVTLALC